MDLGSAFGPLTDGRAHHKRRRIGPTRFSACSMLTGSASRRRFLSTSTCCCRSAHEPAPGLAGSGGRGAREARAQPCGRCHHGALRCGAVPGGRRRGRDDDARQARALLRHGARAEPQPSAGKAIGGCRLAGLAHLLSPRPRPPVALSNLVRLAAERIVSARADVAAALPCTPCSARSAVAARALADHGQAVTTGPGILRGSARTSSLGAGCRRCRGG
jgi:hypothetical protein